MAFGGPTVADRLFGTGSSASGAGTSNWFTRTFDPTKVEMDYNSAEALRNREFNAAEAQKNRDFKSAWPILLTREPLRISKRQA